MFRVVFFLSSYKQRLTAVIMPSRLKLWFAVCCHTSYHAVLFFPLYELDCYHTALFRGRGSANVTLNGIRISVHCRQTLIISAFIYTFKCGIIHGLYVSESYILHCPHELMLEESTSAAILYVCLTAVFGVSHDTFVLHWRVVLHSRYSCLVDMTALCHEPGTCIASRGIFVGLVNHLNVCSLCVDCYKGPACFMKVRFHSPWVHVFIKASVNVSCKLHAS